MTRPDQFCAACARPLKEKMTVQDGKTGKLVKVWACKSPICREYGKPVPR
jgi:hypothetical protein